jgi:hypothetical protein
LPSSEKIKLPHGILGYFFTGYPEWEVGSTRIYKKLLQLSCYDYNDGKGGLCNNKSPWLFASMQAS